MVFVKDEVRKRLQKLNEGKSPGPDGLHPLLLKECAASIAEPLAIIFSKSYESGLLPTDWKMAQVIPIFKKDSKNDKANYRPVSLTAISCKIMEAMIREKMLVFLEENKLLSQSQHGFTRGRSCLTNLLESLEDWTAALDEGYGLDILFLDYKKAFDSVPHKRLIEKLKTSGIQGQLLNWIEDFLKARTMKVKIRGVTSTMKDVLSGVPQGSVLGPILFLLFVNDLPEWIKSSMKMFADDSKVWRRIKTMEDGDALHEDLNMLVDWSQKWSLGFNSEKCKVMHVGHSKPTKYYMKDEAGSTELQSIVEEKDLGVWVRADLKPSTQCVQVAARARRIIGMTRRNFRRLDKQDFLIIYKTYIRPHLEYCVH